MEIRYRNLLFVFLIITSMVISIACFASTNDKDADTKWDYHGNLGPENWGILNSSFNLCTRGKSQSPIDIESAINQNLNKLIINYQSAPFIIMDDGHAIELDFPKTKESITFSNNQFRLVQLHFHIPSENELHGHRFPAEIHFVHRNSEGQLEVVGIFIKEGKENKILQIIIEHLPKQLNQEYTLKDLTVNPLNLFPANKSYYSFMGSLTTPPCTEGVRWILFAEPIEASSEQIAKLQQLLGEQNARSIQPLNHRKITFTKVGDKI